MLSSLFKNKWYSRKPKFDILTIYHMNKLFEILNESQTNGPCTKMHKKLRMHKSL